MRPVTFIRVTFFATMAVLCGVYAFWGLLELPGWTKLWTVVLFTSAYFSGRESLRLWDER